jgi:hypothetical protein
MTRHALIVPLIALAGCGVDNTPPPQEPLALPLVVSDYYSPDGLWGDGETRGAVDVQKSCPDRPAGALGDCYRITYTPGDRRFAGIDWQFPHNNWGQQPGLRITAGATRITVWARGDRGGETVKLGAGQGGTMMYRDNFDAPSVEVALTRAWARYEVPLGPAGYQSPSGVIGAFVLALDAGSDGSARVFFLDDLRWQR